MSDFIEIPLPEENPLSIIVEDTPKTAARGRKKKVAEAPAEEPKAE